MLDPWTERLAKLVLLHSVKGARAGLTVLPPLVVHADDERAFSAQVSAMVE